MLSILLTFTLLIKFLPQEIKFKSRKSNKLKVGVNALANRLFILNDQIPIKRLVGGYETFKVKSKELFLKI